MTEVVTGRRCAWVCKPAGRDVDSGLFRITSPGRPRKGGGAGKDEVAYYFCRRVPTQLGGVAVEMIRLDARGRARRYHLLLAENPNLDHCDCPDATFRHHKPCKHRNAARILFAGHWLPEVGGGGRS